jgi:hypothetical protein
MRSWLVVVGAVAVPMLAVAAPPLPKRFATERFASVESTAKLPPLVTRAVDRYTGFRGLRDAGAHLGFGGCVPTSGRALVLAGIGRDLDFVLYEHGGPAMARHDHLLVLAHGAEGLRTVVYSCTGNLPRQPKKLLAAVLRGECTQTLSAVENY